MWGEGGWGCGGEELAGKGMAEDQASSRPLIGCRPLAVPGRLSLSHRPATAADRADAQASRSAGQPHLQRHASGGLKRLAHDPGPQPAPRRHAAPPTVRAQVVQGEGVAFCRQAARGRSVGAGAGVQQPSKLVASTAHATSRSLEEVQSGSAVVGASSSSRIRSKGQQCTHVHTCWYSHIG